MILKALLKSQLNKNSHRLNVNWDKRERNFLGFWVVQLHGDRVETVLVSFCALLGRTFTHL